MEQNLKRSHDDMVENEQRSTTLSSVDASVQEPERKKIKANNVEELGGD